MIDFSPAIDEIARNMMEVELLFVQYFSFDLFLNFVFAHHFKKNGTVAMKDFVSFPNGFGSGAPQLNMVTIFAGGGAEDFAVAPYAGALQIFKREPSALEPSVRSIADATENDPTAIQPQHHQDL